MIEITVRLYSKVDADGRGQFQPTSFTEYIGRRVEITGLDAALHHVLKAVENTEDGTVSTLTVHTHSEVDADLTANMSVRWDTPTAEVRGYVDDELLVTARMDAPVQEGQTVRVGEKLYNVTATSNPARQPDGTTAGPDYQRADLVETDAPTSVADLGVSPFGALLLGG
jgi:hypothetical protein